MDKEFKELKSLTFDDGVQRNVVVDWNETDETKGGRILHKPTKLSQFKNDSGFITKAVDDLANYYLKSETYTKDEIKQLIGSIPKFSIQVVTALPSSNISPTTVYLLNTGNESDNLYTEYIYVNNKWEYLGKQTVDLSGYALKTEVPTKLSQLTNDSGYLVTTQVNSLISTALSGYSKTSHTHPTYESEIDSLKESKANKSESVLCIAQNLTEAQKAQARANIGATAGEDVEFADSLEWLNENGDSSKKYVLPDGYVYAYSQKTVTEIHNANDGTGFKNIRPTASPGTNKDANTTKNGLFTTAPIEVDNSWSDCIVNISGLEKLVPTFYASLYVYWFDESGTYIRYSANNALLKPDGSRLTTAAEVDIPLPISIDISDELDHYGHWAKTKYVRLALGIKLSGTITDSDIEGLVINFERLNSEKTEYGWYSTGQQHSNDKATQQNSADIATLKEEVATLKEAVSKSPSNSGAKWFAIGDSITYGLYSTSASDYYQPVIGQRWVDYVAQYNSYELTNLGKSGSGFITGTTFRNIVDANSFANVDLVTIMLGINDWKNYSAVGQEETIVSELRYGLEKIINDNPYCKIIVITPLNAKIGDRGTEDTNWAYGFNGSGTPFGSLKSFGDKLKEVCEYYGIQVVDMTNSSVVNRKSITTVLPDGIHPNLECYEVLGKELARRITFA